MASRSIAVRFVPGSTGVVPVGVSRPAMGGHFVRDVVLPDQPAVVGREWVCFIFWRTN